MVSKQRMLAGLVVPDLAPGREIENSTDLVLFGTQFSF